MSGAASLGLEVVWSRLLRLVFGSTTLAVTTILVAYMLGLGAGGLWGGRIAARVRNGVRAYGLFEIAVGLYALCVPTILALYPALNRSVPAGLGFWPAAWLRFGLVLAVLILPTFLMGATLPVLVAALTRGGTGIADRVGLLYGTNTLGAVAGVLGATFVGFATLGVRGTNALSAGLDVAAGLVAVFVLAPRLGRAPTEAPAPGPDAPAVGRRWSPLLLTYGVVGFTALAYEISWTRALSMILGSSTYAFATMLAGFLAGIALGSLLARRAIDRLADPVRAYSIGLLALGLLSLGVMVGFGFFPDLFLHAFVAGHVDGRRLAWLGLGMAFLVMLGPTLVLGALFPLLVRVIAGGPRDAGGAVGDVYFVNTVGSAAGALCTGFLLIPLLGLQDTMALAVGLNLLTAALVVVWRRRATGRRGWTWAVAGLAAAALVVAFPPAWHAERLALGVYYRSRAQLDFGLPPLPMPGVPGEEMLYYREGINCTISVHRTEGGIEEGGVSLRINGKTDASLIDMSTQILSGHIPILFGSGAESALVIGYASGITTGAAALHGLRTLDVCEIEPAVIEASHFFDDYNHRPLQRPEVRRILDDGRIYLDSTDARYDVIVSEPSNPWISGCANLFTSEFFEAAHRALNPGGRLLQWVQLYDMDEAGVRSILAALHEHFAYAYGFLYDTDSTDLMLLATDRPLTLDDLPRWEDLPEAVRADLSRVRVASTADLWSLLFVPPDELATLGAGAPVLNTDDTMYVELNAPWHLYDGEHAMLDVLTRVADGILPLLRAAPDVSAPPDELLGELALSYLDRRLHGPVADAIHDELVRRGDEVFAPVIEAERMLLTGSGSPAQALALLDAAVRAAPDAYAPRFHRGWLLERMQRFDEALDDLDRAHELRPDQLEVRLERAGCLVSLDRFAEAEEDYAALLASPLVETEHALWAEAAYVADRAGQPDRAIERMTRYVELMPYTADAWQVLAAWRERAGQAEQASVARANVGLARRNLARFYHRTALYYERFGDPVDAVPALQYVLELDPDNTAARADLQRLQVR